MVGVESVSDWISLLSIFLLAVLAASPITTAADAIDVECGLALEIIGLYFSVHEFYYLRRKCGCDILWDDKAAYSKLRRSKVAI